MNVRLIRFLIYLAAAILVVVVIVDIGPLPMWVANLDHMQRSLHAVQAMQFEQNIRSTILQAIGGVLLVSGAIATWQQVSTANNTLTLSKRIQAIDTFSRAIDQLGSEILTTRIGGIYALDGIARSSADETGKVCALLNAFVRKPPSNPLSNTEADVQAAIGILTSGYYKGCLNFTDAKLRGAILTGADLEGAVLSGTILRAADLTGANLKETVLRNADLRGATLANADLSGSDICGCDLRDVDITKVILTDVKKDASTRLPQTP